MKPLSPQLTTVFHLIPWTSVKSFSLPTFAQEPINFSKSEYLSKDSGGRHYSSGLRATDTFVIMKKIFASQGPVFKGRLNKIVKIWGGLELHE